MAWTGQSANSSERDANAAQAGLAELSPAAVGVMPRSFAHFERSFASALGAVTHACQQSLGNDNGEEEAPVWTVKVRVEVELTASLCLHLQSATSAEHRVCRSRE